LASAVFDAIRVQPNQRTLSVWSHVPPDFRAAPGGFVETCLILAEGWFTLFSLDMVSCMEICCCRCWHRWAVARNGF